MDSKIKLLNSPILRKKTTVVTEFDDAKLREIVDHMNSVMYAENGVGLAANQIGLDMAVCVIDISKERNNPKAYFNPEITGYSLETTENEEGCLSIPGVNAKVERSTGVVVKYQTVFGEERVEELSGDEAIAMQHEVDHLNGKLYIDHLGPVKKQLTIDRHRKYLKAKARGAL